VDRADVAKVGALVFAWALIAPTLAGASARSDAAMVGSVVEDAIAPPHVATAVMSRGVATTIADAADIPVMPVRVRVLGSVSRPGPGPEAFVEDGVVVASWYGPGFYGRRTACGQTYTPEILGVAHRVLRCGTLITITSPKGITLTVPVIDRGPYIAGRALDLSNATRLALSCSDLCRVRMTVLQ
jgi:rare lipoprotein A